MNIGKNTVVALRYVMYNSKDEVLEDTMSSAPVNYLHGSAGILVLLQQQLEGLQKGDKNKVWLKKTSDIDDDFRFDVVIDHVRVASDEEVMLGYPLQVYSGICGGDCECYCVNEE